MEILRKPASTEGGPDLFTGDAWIDVVLRGEPLSRVRVNVVRVAPGSRNAWHVHAVGQTVHVTEGIGRIQTRAAEVVEIRPGDTVHTRPKAVSR